ncbi:eae-like domain protein [Enterobacter hormaechei]|uniref:eae-like domain protein n=1 Tax=Enterobacter hormaechei TaxID=158836 RepID=UPI001F469BD8|nr:eae-like domain protein [Enterobacter hormaechei]UJA61021.1 eae-like domain protein [Enterobacter hormaechei]
MTNVSAVEKMAELMQQMEENSPRVAALQYCLTQVAEKVEEAEKRNAELEARCAALAAENSGLKAACEDRRTFIMNGVQLGYIQVPTVETDPALETIRVAVSPQEPTPATDAFLAEVRAQGVDAAIEHLINKFEGTGRIGVPVMALEWLAKDLRKGVQS